VRAISKRLGKLEGRFGLVETEERRRERVFVETLRRRIDARRAQKGLRPLGPDPDEQNLMELTRSEILRRHFKARNRPVP